MSLPTYEPMLATKWPEPFDDDAWSFEIKWDGYRAIVGHDGSQIRARSRRGLDLTGPFPEISSAPVPEGVVLDGEIVAFDENGRPSFSLLQQRTGFGGRGTESRVGVNYVVFDVLFKGADLTGEPYHRRRALLEELDLPSPIVVPDATPD